MRRLKRPSNNHSSALESELHRTVRPGKSKSPIPEARSTSNQGQLAAWEKLVDQIVKGKTQAFHADNGLQKECVQCLNTFKEEIKNLESQIHEFIDAVRPLGSSSGLIFSARRLRYRMAEIQDRFSANAAAIYVAFRENLTSELPEDLRVRSPVNFGRQGGSMESFPDLLQDLASEVREFMHSLRDIPEFSDKGLTESLDAFAAWMDYRANGLQDFGAELETPALYRYTNGLMVEMGKYLNQTGDALKHFGTGGETDLIKGVKSIQDAQKRSKEQLQNMSTVATFFSGVAATTFQYTSGNQDSALDEIVRALWVSSLILSIASAINSQLAMHWRTAMYRSPRSALPMWTSLCLNQTPILFLTFSVLTFSIGLVIYTYSSSQGKLVTLCATVLTSFTSLILLTVILWEGGERWQAYKWGRTSQEIDIGPGVPVAHQPWEPYQEVKHFNMRIVELVWRGTRLAYLVIRKSFKRLFSYLPRGRTPATAGLSVLPVPIVTLGGVQRQASTASVGSDKNRDGIRQDRQVLSSPPGEPFKLGFQVDRTSQEVYPEPISPMTFDGRDHGHRLYKTAWQLARDPTLRDRLDFSPVTPEGLKCLKSLELENYYTHPEVAGPVQDLQFAPDGKWLATSFRDGTVGLWRVDSSLKWNSALAGQQGNMTWHQKMPRLLLPLKGSVEVWEPTAVGQGRRVKSGLEAFTWLQDGQNFVAVKGNRLYILIIMLCTIKDDAWNEETPEGLLSFFGALSQSIRPKGIQPQQRIIIYDITRARVSTEVPVWGDAQHIAVSRNGKFALVSYGSTAPPELWNIRIPASGNVSLELCHIYRATSNAGVDESTRELVGRASFGGDSDEYVVATTKDGHVYVWECASSQLCHSIKNVQDKTTNGEVTGVSWCPSNGDRSFPLLACGTTDGELVVWSARIDRDESGANESRNPSSEASNTFNKSEELEIQEGAPAGPAANLT
ncbi:hypothetical protein FRC04_009602 [Tulasnella sp. 424]|nr:hypothetical protein FRC04_009602 [Tulasnella sp. 424]